MKVASVLILVVGCAAPAATAPSPAWVDPTLVPRIPVVTDGNCPNNRNCSVVEVLDIHTAADSQDKGFDELRRRAAMMGADAVVGAEFEHGDGNEPSHLSGMLVRYSEALPPHEEIGAVDIPSDENDQDKGLREMTRRATAMGGDRVIDISFEHGDDGAQGHLRGRVIRYTR